MGAGQQRIEPADPGKADLRLHNPELRALAGDGRRIPRELHADHHAAEVFRQAHLLHLADRDSLVLERGLAWLEAGTVREFDRDLGAMVAPFAGEHPEGDPQRHHRNNPDE